MISKLAADDAEAPPPEINRVRRMGTGSTYSSINASTSWGGLSSVASGELGISRIGTSSSMGYDQPWGFGESFAEDLAGALALASPPPKLPLSPSVREGLQRALKASDEDSPYALADEFADSPYALPPPPVAPPPASPKAAPLVPTPTSPAWRATPPPSPRRRSAFYPVLDAANCVDAFVVAKRLDAPAEAALRALSPYDHQVRLVRCLEPKHGDQEQSRLVRASILARTNFAATASELKALAPSLCRAADALALRSESVLLLATLGAREQGRLGEGVRRARVRARSRGRRRRVYKNEYCHYLLSSWPGRWCHRSIS